MSTATVVSIVPYEVKRSFPGVFPGYYAVPASLDGQPTTLEVKDATSYMYVLDGKGVNLLSPGSELANSICNDFISSQLAKLDDAHPGIFWVEGKVAATDVKTKFKSELERAEFVQRNWFKHLVQMADDDWQRYHQYKTIADIQRHAARTLQLERDWIDVMEENRINCPVCTTELRKAAIVCPSCRAILDKEKYKQFQFASV